MSARKQVRLHKAFVTVSDKTFEDTEGDARHYLVAHMPKGLIVNGTPVGGATFTARYCHLDRGSPDILVFGFKPGTLVNLSVPVRNAGGEVEAFATVGVTPDDLEAALADQRASFHARRYAKARDASQERTPMRLEPTRYGGADEALSAIEDAIDRYRDRGRPCSMRDLYAVLVSLADSWEDITRSQDGEAEQDQQPDFPDCLREMDDPYDLTEYRMDDMRSDGCAPER